MKTAFKGKRFQDVEDVKEHVTAELTAVPLEAFAQVVPFLTCISGGIQDIVCSDLGLS
jgi:RNA-splicing ligase RtcB